MVIYNDLQLFKKGLVNDRIQESVNIGRISFFVFGFFFLDFFSLCGCDGRLRQDVTKGSSAVRV